jgi:hypothetical protein
MRSRPPDCQRYQKEWKPNDNELHETISSVRGEAEELFDEVHRTSCCKRIRRQRNPKAAKREDDEKK